VRYSIFTELIAGFRIIEIKSVSLPEQDLALEDIETGGLREGNHASLSLRLIIAGFNERSK
jgi:hypothetical protein